MECLEYLNTKLSTTLRNPRTEESTKVRRLESAVSAIINALLVKYGSVLIINKSG